MPDKPERYTGRTAYALVERARRDGWKRGAIVDAIGVTETAIRVWETRPEVVPHRSTARRLAEFAATLDKRAAKAGAK